MSRSHKSSKSKRTPTPSLSPTEARQREEIKEAFNIFDKNGDGKITANELGQVMRSLGQHPTEGELRFMIQEVDIDENGTLDFEEFYTLMRQKLDIDTTQEAQLVEAFHVFDKDGDGFLTADELRQAMLNLGEKLTDQELQDMICICDVNKDGLIDYKEFVKIITKST